MKCESNQTVQIAGNLGRLLSLDQRFILVCITIGITICATVGITVRITIRMCIIFRITLQFVLPFVLSSNNAGAIMVCGNAIPLHTIGEDRYNV